MSQKKVSIIATVGPAVNKPVLLKKLVQSGVSVFRINASHCNPLKLQRMVRSIDKVFKGHPHRPKILVDLQGPRVRTGHLVGGKPIQVKAGSMVNIHVSSSFGKPGEITTPCPEFMEMVKIKDEVLLDNGHIKLKVLQIRKNSVRCKVLEGGPLGENKGINLPKARPKLPALSDKDLLDLEAILDIHCDYLALSFVRTAKDVKELRKFLNDHHKNIKIISKIEKPVALKNLSKIIAASDQIMIARGDLGIEIGVEWVPVIQKQIIAMAKKAKKKVIVATQMLESMIDNHAPTRAEVSDVANAVLDGADAVMLSGETAVGNYPVATVRIMKKVIQSTMSTKKRVF